MVMNKRNGQIMVPTEKENLAKLMVCHTHYADFEDAKRRTECITSIVNVHPFDLEIFSLAHLSQYISNRFHIVFLRHNHINNRYFEWEKLNSPSEISARIVCVLDMFDAVAVSWSSSSSSSIAFRLNCWNSLAKKQREKNWRFSRILTHWL